MLFLRRKGFGQDLSSSYLSVLGDYNVDRDLLLTVDFHPNNRFFFTDERSVEGGISAPPKGKSHARFYLRLTEDDGVPSYATFVDGEYREFFP